MLKKLSDGDAAHELFKPGKEVYIVTRDGEILEGFHIKSVLIDLVSLDKSPLDGTEKQGFTISGNQLKPNWCDGRKSLIGAFATKEEALRRAEKRRSKQKEGDSL